MKYRKNFKGVSFQWTYARQFTEQYYFIILMTDLLRKGIYSLLYILRKLNEIKRFILYFLMSAMYHSDNKCWIKKFFIHLYSVNLMQSSFNELVLEVSLCLTYFWKSMYRFW